MSSSSLTHTHEIAFRDTEMFALVRAASAHRVIVLTGPPGIGKSALAMAFAYQKKRVKQPEAVIAVNLEDARTSIEVVHEIARVLGIATPATAEASAIAERIGRALAARRRMIVVLDDVDRCRVALAKLLTAFLRDAPAASFLVTARGRLGVAGEHKVEVGPLDVPAKREKDADAISKSPAVQLFARRAAIARAGFRITPSNARIVASIVQKLEGVPLAIELCASRMIALSERDIADLLDERLDLLEDERGERSIRSAFALSWEELDVEDANLLAACSCFRGGFFLDAACAVASTGAPGATPSAKTRVRVARSLERLVESSLVRVDDGEERRYMLPETLRVFAREKLTENAAEVSAIEERHARHYAGLRSQSPTPSLDVLALERKNLEEAFDRSLRAKDRSQGPWGAGAILSLAPMALTRGPLAPFIDRTKDALDRLDLDPADRAEIHYVRGLARVFQGKRDEGLLELVVARDEARKTRSLRVEALATSRIGVVTGLKGNVDEALSIFEDARKAAEKSADDLTRGIVQKDLANILSEAGRNDDAVVELGRARKFLRAAGDVREEGFVLMMLGSRFYDDGRLQEARRDCTAALTLLRQAGDRRSEGWTLGLLALVDAEEGDMSNARRHLETALGLIRDVGDEHTEGLLLGFLGNVALEQGVLTDAETAYRDCVVRLARAGDRASEGFFTATASVVEALLGRLPSAHDGLQRARELLEGDGRAARRDAVEILASVIDGGAGDGDSDGDGDGDAAASIAAPSWKNSKNAPVEEVRFARRVLASLTTRATLTEGAPESDAMGTSELVVASDGSWVRTGRGQLAKLGSGRPIARVMYQLALERVRHPGRPVPPQSLVRAGWPGERVLPAAAKNRLHVTIARLRRVALEDMLLHDDEGYFLDPKKGARLADPGESPR